MHYCVTRQDIFLKAGHGQRYLKAPELSKHLPEHNLLLTCNRFLSTEVKSEGKIKAKIMTPKQSAGTKSITLNKLRENHCFLKNVISCHNLQCFAPPQGGTELTVLKKV